jgi:hypothetical protein
LIQKTDEERETDENTTNAETLDFRSRSFEYVARPGVVREERDEVVGGSLSTLYLYAISLRRRRRRGGSTGPVIVVVGG